MNSKEILEIARGIIRPYLAFVIPSAMVGIAIYLAIKFADAGLARDLIIIVATAASMITAFYFGERSGKKKEEK